MNKPAESNLPPALKSAEHLSWDEAQKELGRLRKQFVVIHDLPTLDKIKPGEYMHETLELLRQRCIAIHWRLIELQIKKND